MRALLRVSCAVFLLIGTVIAQRQAAGSESPSDADSAIAAVLHAQVEAWNRGDLKGFMGGYWNSPDLVFATEMQETRGWEEVYNRYRVKYQSRKDEMGKLDLSYIKPAHLLAPDVAYVDGEYRLTKADGGTSDGYFTLIFGKLPEGWRIVHDRTCPK